MNGLDDRREESLDVGAFAIELWRVQARLKRALPLLPAKEARPLETSIARLAELLRAAGVSVDDPEGRPYIEGERMDVLLFEPQEGLERPVILQTVKPSVFREGVRVRTAEVIVGVPSADAISEDDARAGAELGAEEAAS